MEQIPVNRNLVFGYFGNAPWASSTSDGSPFIRFGHVVKLKRRPKFNLYAHSVTTENADDETLMEVIGAFGVAKAEVVSLAQMFSTVHLRQRTRQALFADSVSHRIDGLGFSNDLQQN